MAEETKTNEGDMPFLDHLEEFRKVIIKSVIALLVSCVIIGIFTVQFNDLLMFPFERAQEIFGKEVPLPRVGSVFSPFFVMFEISIFGGIFFALPFILYYIGQFIIPALTNRERKVIKPALVASTILFVAGAAMAFFFMLPIGISFSFSISEMMNWEILYDIQNYYSFIVWVPLATGVSFQLPLLIILFIYIGLLTPEFLRKNRRIIFVVILIFSAIVTPPDPLTLILLTVPLYLLYEAAVFVGVRLLAGKIEKDRAEEEARKKEDEEYYRKYVEEQNKLEEDYYRQSSYNPDNYPENYEVENPQSENSDEPKAEEEEEFDYEKYYAYSMNEINKMGEAENSAKEKSENLEETNAETEAQNSANSAEENTSEAKENSAETATETPEEKTDK